MRPGAPSVWARRPKWPRTCGRFTARSCAITGADSFIEGGDILVDRDRDPRRPLGPHQCRRHRRTDAPRRPLGPYGARGAHPARRPAFQDRLLAAGRGTDPVHQPPVRLGLLCGLPGHRVAEGEEAAANTIRFNDLVLMPAGFPRTRDALVAAGFTVREIGNSECAKLDGGMSCLSLALHPELGVITAAR